MARGSPLEVFLVALRLGLTSFGGPMAHLGYFREEYVRRRAWLDDAAYADLVALCQFLPGPASSQVGIAIGTRRAGLLGGLAAWAGFTLPSAAALIVFAYTVRSFDVADAGWLHGLKVAAVAIVAYAVWGMARALAPDRARATLAVLAAVLVLGAPSAVTQIAVIVAGGLAGWRLPAVAAVDDPATASPARSGSAASLGWLVAFVLLLVALPVTAHLAESQAIALVDGFYRAGSLVFGGGHVVLPLLQTEVVDPGWLTTNDFIAGYGAAQAVPGPLFSFAAYLGAASVLAPNGWLGGVIALCAVFLPSFLLVWGVLPIWERVRSVAAFRAALRGVGAAVVGLLLAALYEPVWTSAIGRPEDFALALACFVLLAMWRVPPWVVVVFAAAGGFAIG